MEMSENLQSKTAQEMAKHNFQKLIGQFQKT